MSAEEFWLLRSTLGECALDFEGKQWNFAPKTCKVDKDSDSRLVDDALKDFSWCSRGLSLLYVQNLVSRIMIGGVSETEDRRLVEGFK